jgi:hypothetical protein
MAANGALEPLSKHATPTWLEGEVFVPAVPEGVYDERLYRAMDLLVGAGEELQRAVYDATADLLNLEVDLLFSGIDTDTTTTSAVSAYPLGEGMNHHVSTVLDRSEDARWCKCRVHDQGDMRVLCYTCYFVEVGHAQLGIADGLHENSSGLRIHSLTEFPCVRMIDKAHSDPQVGQDIVEHGIRPTVKVARGN